VARWELLATVGANRTTVDAELDLTQPGMGSSQLEILLPPGSLPRKFTGDQLKTWASHNQGGQTVMHARLSQGLQGKARFFLRYEIPLSPKEEVLELQFPTLPSALRERTILAIAPQDVIEIFPDQAQFQAVASMPVEDLPKALVQRSRAPVLAAYHSVRSQGSIRLPLRRLQAQAYPQLVVRGINGLTVTARGRNAAGEDRLSLVSKLVLQLQNTGSRYLDLELPAGAEVLSCSVARRPTPPLKDPRVPGHLRIPIPLSRKHPQGLEVYPVALSYRHDQPGNLDQKKNLEFPLPVVHAPVAETSWKIYTPEEMHILAFQGGLSWSNQVAPFAPEKLTRIFFEEIVEPVLWILFLLLCGAGIFVGLRSRSPRGLLGSTWNLVRSRLFSLLVVFIIIGVLGAIAVPNFQSARRRANVRACFANQKTIAGAVEMYNLDFNTDAHENLAGLLPELQRNGYLQSIPNDPLGGANSHSNYIFDPTSSSGISCRLHGPIQGSHSGHYRAAAPLSSLPQGRRSTPVDVSIPSQGEEILLERGFLETGRPLTARLEFLDARTLAIQRPLGLIMGFLLVLLGAVWLPQHPLSELLLGGGVLAGTLLADSMEVSLAGAFLVGILGSLGLLAAGRLAQRLPGWVRTMGGRMASLGGGAALILLLTLPPPSSAEVPPTLAPIEVLQMAGQDLKGKVLVSRESYRKLLEARDQEPPQRPPVQRLTARVQDLGSIIEARLQLQVLPTAGWFSILGEVPGVQLLGATVAGKSWPLNPRGTSWIAAPLPDGGRLELLLLLPRKRSSRGIRCLLPTPLAALATLEVAPRPGSRILVAGLPHYKMSPIPATGQALSIVWEKQGKEAHSEAPVVQQTDLSATTYYLVELGARDAQVSAHMKLRVEGGPLSEVRLHQPPGWTTLEVHGPNLADWEQEEGDITLSFRKPWKGERELELEFEVSRKNSARLELSFPWLRATTREQRLIAISAPAERSLEFPSSSTLALGTQEMDLPWPFQPERLSQIQARFELPGKARFTPLTATVRSLESINLQQASVDVARYQGEFTEDGHLLLEARLQVKNATRQFLRVHLPKGFRLYSTHVGGNAVRTASGKDGEVLFPLQRSQVIDGALAPFSVRWVMGIKVQGPAPGTFQLELPKIDLPVGTFRAKLGLPQGQLLVELQSNATQSLQELPVSFPELPSAAPGASLEIPMPHPGRPLYLSRELLRPGDGVLFLKGRLIPEEGKRSRRLGHFALGFAGLWILLILLARAPRPGVTLAAVGALVVVAAALLSASTHPGPKLLAAVGAFDAWILRVLLVGWRRE
jgi:type II secretory pathway pseudopilin PulG